MNDVTSTIHKDTFPVLTHRLLASFIALAVVLMLCYLFCTICLLVTVQTQNAGSSVMLWASEAAGTVWFLFLLGRLHPVFWALLITLQSFVVWDRLTCRWNDMQRLCLWTASAWLLLVLVLFLSLGSFRADPTGLVFASTGPDSQWLPPGFCTRRFRSFDFSAVVFLKGFHPASMIALAGCDNYSRGQNFTHWLCLVLFAL